MKYFLGIDTKKSKETDNSDRYIPIKWEKIQPPVDNDPYNLVNICNFTMSYNNYDELFDDLIKNNVISYLNKSKDLVIVYKNKGIYKHLRFGITYNKERKYFDPQNIICILLTKRKDLEFLKKLVNNYKSIPPVSFLMNDLTNYISDIKLHNESEINYEELINDFVIKISYKYDKEKHSIKTNTLGEALVDPRPLRDLAMLVNYYENHPQKSKKEEVTEFKTQNLFDTTPKILTRKFPEYEQLTFI